MTTPVEPVPTWTSPQDVVNRWLPVGTEPEGEEELERVQALIEDIEDFIESRFPTIEARIENGSIKVSKIRRIVSNAVIRAWKMAKDPRLSFSESEGPSSISGSYSNALQRSQYLTSDELNELAPRRGQGFTQDLAPHAGRNAFDNSEYLNPWANPVRNELGWKIRATEWSSE